MPVRAGDLTDRAVFKRRSPVTDTPGSLRGGFIRVGTAYANFDESDRPAQASIADLAIQVKSGTLLIRDTSGARAMSSREHRVEIDGDDYRIQNVSYADPGVIALSLTGTVNRAGFETEVEQRGEEITVRRVVANAPAIEVTARAIVTGYSPDELVGGVNQADRKVFLSAQDLEDKDFPEPLKRNDKVVIRGKLMNVEDVDDSTFREAGELIAYRLRVTG